VAGLGKALVSRRSAALSAKLLFWAVAVQAVSARNDMKNSFFKHVKVMPMIVKSKDLNQGWAQKKTDLADPPFPM